MRVHTLCSLHHHPVLNFYFSFFFLSLNVLTVSSQLCLCVSPLYSSFPGSFRFFIRPFYVCVKVTLLSTLPTYFPETPTCYLMFPSMVPKIQRLLSFAHLIIRFPQLSTIALPLFWKPRPSALGLGRHPIHLFRTSLPFRRFSFRSFWSQFWFSPAPFRRRRIGDGPLLFRSPLFSDATG